MKKPEQVTLNEAIEKETGEPTPPNTVKLAARTLTRPGHVRKYIHIPDAAWEQIAAHIEANDLDEERFLTRQLTAIAAGLAGLK